MKLSRLYSNRPELFQEIQFNAGLSVVLAEIKRPENKGKTVHNLGKSTVARLVDFCLLKGRHQSFFLFAHPELFAEFTFFLQVQLSDSRFLTVARAVNARKPVSILMSDSDIANALDIPIENWAHVELGMAPAKRLLDGLLGFSVISPYGYRELMGYVLREQDDYGDVFHLKKFRGKHREWKPFLAHLLGLDADLTASLYNEIELEESLESDISGHRREGGAGDSDVVKIEGIIAIRSRELEELTSTLETFNFSQVDADANQELVERVEEEIYQLNEETYRLSQLLWRIDESLKEESILFSPEDAVQLFEDAGVAFEGQLKRELTQLVNFNRAISEERKGYLLEERGEIISRLAEINPALSILQTRRASLFDFLESSDTLDKYKETSARAISLGADITSLSRQRDALNEIVQLRQKQRQVQERKNALQTAIELDVKKQAEDDASRYRKIQQYFDEIIHEVLDEHALLAVSASPTGSLEFSADIVDASGIRTSAARGFTFKKLLCIAFDLAVLRAYLGENFPRFACHDGVFESLETRAKGRLLNVLRRYADMGLQPLITTLDSDLPEPVDSSRESIETHEIVCQLTDETHNGRLFRMPSF